MSGRNLDRMYQHIATRVEEMFQSEECDWDALNTLIDDSLLDPFLPRWHRTKFHAIRALCSDRPEYNIERAEAGIAEMREVRAVELEYLGLQGEEKDRILTEIDEEMQPLEDMIKLVKEALEEVDEEEAAASKEGTVATASQDPLSAPSAPTTADVQASATSAAGKGKGKGKGKRLLAEDVPAAGPSEMQPSPKKKKGVPRKITDEDKVIDTSRATSPPRRDTGQRFRSAEDSGSESEAKSPSRT